MAKLFNILIDVVVREWIQELRVGGGFEEHELLEFMATFFTIFYIDDTYLTRSTSSLTYSNGSVLRQTRPRLR